MSTPTSAIDALEKKRTDWNGMVQAAKALANHIPENTDREQLLKGMLGRLNSFKQPIASSATALDMRIWNTTLSGNWAIQQVFIVEACHVVLNQRHIQHDDRWPNIVQHISTIVHYGETYGIGPATKGKFERLTDRFKKIEWPQKHWINPISHADALARYEDTQHDAEESPSAPSALSHVAKVAADPNAPKKQLTLF